MPPWHFVLSCCCADRPTCGGGDEARASRCVPTSTTIDGDRIDGRMTYCNYRTESVRINGAPSPHFFSFLSPPEFVRTKLKGGRGRTPSCSAPSWCSSQFKFPCPPTINASTQVYRFEMAESVVGLGRNRRRLR